MLANGLIDDPFYRMNELSTQWVDKVDWEYRSNLKLDSTTLARQRIDLVCKGLDTFALVSVNGERVLVANNMFREWRVGIKEFLREGDNEVHIRFRSPLNQGLALLESFGLRLPSANDLSKLGGFGSNQVSMFVRKAGYHFGWDWGPRLVTSGVWRPIALEIWDEARIEDVFIRQDLVADGVAELMAIVGLEASVPTGAVLTIASTSHGLAISETRMASLKPGVTAIEIPLRIDNPRLWWCNGMGQPNLYEFRITLSLHGTEVHSQTIRTGIRTLRLMRTPDSKGESFHFELNGVAVFAKGANYIPSDSFLPRVTPQRYEALVLDAARANMNMLRVWGGGVYEDDMFYNLCDERGIMVWHDFMFSCAMYPGTPEFLENVRIEAKQNVVRLRNHPCIALWCGNNEMNYAWQYYGNDKWGWKKDYNLEERELLNNQYNDLFHNIIPEIVRGFTQTSYWPSSPMSGPEPHQHAGYENASGDIHYWGVWHDLHPFESFEKYVGRFMSEYGFQSFPEFETVKGFTIPTDWDIESEVMAWHQRSGIGNLRIKEYMEQEYIVPSDFEQFLYLSQVLQARSIRMAIEAHRRAMPYCMGTLYWQLNDCWPVASWSSIDYHHRWKALHYAVRNAYEPVIVSAMEREGVFDVYVISDHPEGESGMLTIQVLDFGGGSIRSFDHRVEVGANTSTRIYSCSVQELLGKSDRQSCFAIIAVELGMGRRVETTHYLAKAKELDLPTPSISIEVRQGESIPEILVSSPRLARDVMFYVPNQQAFFHQNYIDLLPGKVYEIPVQTELTPAQLINAIRYRHLKV